MSPDSVYALRMVGVEAIEQGQYAEGLNALAAATLEEAKNRDAGHPVISPPHREITPLWIDHTPKITEEEMREARERIKERYRKPIPDQMSLF